MANQYICIAKRAYAPVSQPDEEVFPGNIAALEKGLEARACARARDFVRENSLWAEAKALLFEESESETGAGAEGSVEVEDTFMMSQMCCPVGNFAGSWNERGW